MKTDSSKYEHDFLPKVLCFKGLAMAKIVDDNKHL